MPQNSGYYQRAIMRDVMLRLKKLQTLCGVNENQNGTTNAGPAKATGTGDEFNTLVCSINCQMEEIKKDCRTRYRMNSTTTVSGDNPSNTEMVAIAHEIRRKRAVLKEDLDRVDALNKDLLLRIEKRRQKSTAKGKEKRQEDVERQEALLKERQTVAANLTDAYGKLEALANRVLSQGSELDELRLKDPTRQGGVLPTRKLKLMQGTVKQDGTFERPQGSDDPPMDAQTKLLFDEIEKKETVINQGLDQVSKMVRTLKEQARAMGDQLTQQNIIFDNLEERMAEVHDKMSGLTLKVGKFSKKVSHSNVLLDVICIIILLGLVGYIIYLFKSQLIPGSS